MTDIICPILKTPGSEAPAATAVPAATEDPAVGSSVVDKVTGSETLVDQGSGGGDEGYFQFKNIRIYGLRTFLIILIIVVCYAALCWKNNDTLGMKDLALMACGFLFGTKAIKRN